MSFLKNSFNGGELGQALRYRPDLEKYGSSLAECVNFYPTPWGGVQNRPGTLYCAELDPGECRLIEFVYNVEQAYILAFQNKILRVFLEGKCTCELIIPYPEHSLFSISYVQSNDILFLAHPDFPPAMLKRVTQTDFVYEVMTLKGGPYKDEDPGEIKLTASGKEGEITVTAESAVFSSGMEGMLLRWASPMSPNAITETFSGNTTGEKKFTFRGSWRVQTGGSFVGTLSIERTSDGEQWEMFREYTVNAERNIDDVGFEEDKYTYRMRFADWGEPPEGTLYECRASLQSESYETWGVIEITRVISETEVEATVKEVLSQTETTTWNYGAWNLYNGYPALVQFTDGDRLIFAKTYAEPNRVWLSKVGDYNNFTADTQADSSILFTLRIGNGNGAVTGNSISFLANRKGVIVGSAAEIGRLVPRSEETPLAPDNKQYVGEVNPGAAVFPPIQINDVLVFVRRGGENLLELSYNYATDGYVAPDMTVLRPDILREGGGIKQLAFVELPFPIIYCLRHDGVIASFTYNRTENVTAWARQITDGKILSISVLQDESGYDETYIAVARQGKVFLEKFDRRNDDLADASVWTDCASVMEGVSACTLSRFANRTVTVKADGVNYEYAVPESGEIDFGKTVKRAEVGLQYIPEIETLPFEMMNGMESTLISKKRIAKVSFKFQNTLGGVVSSSDHPGKNVIFREMKDLTNGPMPVRSGSYEISLPDRWTFEKFVTIRQPEPYPMTVLAMVCDLEG